MQEIQQGNENGWVSIRSLTQMIQRIAAKCLASAYRAELYGSPDKALDQDPNHILELDRIA